MKNAFVQHCLEIYAAALLAHMPLAAEGFEFFEPIQPPRKFQVMAHRGASAQAPENTGPALVRSIQEGFEWAEVDVRLTKDGHHVLSHGEDLITGASQPLSISEHTLAELKEADIGSVFAARYAGEHLLTLQECFNLAKGKLNLYLDCKAIDPESLIREIIASGMEHQVIVYASPSLLKGLQSFGQGKAALMTKWHPAFGIEPWANSNHVSAVEIDANEITPAVASSFHNLRIKVQVKVLGDWDGPEFWDKAVAAGADWLQTDLPEEMLAHALWRRVKKRPALISLHRGASRYAPENTLPAFAKAIRLGADFVEFDVRTTSDGQFFLLHDNTLEGKTDGHGPIATTPSGIIRALSAGVKFGRGFAHEPLPSLDDFLSAVEGKINLYFDAKAISPEALAEAVERHHMAERTVVYQSVPYLIRLKSIDPRIRALPPLNTPAQLPLIAEKLMPYAIDAKWGILSKDLIARCHSLGILVFSDALGDHERIQDYLQAIEWGIDLIQTDHPMRLMRAFELRDEAGTRSF